MALDLSRSSATRNASFAASEVSIAGLLLAGEEPSIEVVPSEPKMAFFFSATAALEAASLARMLAISMADLLGSVDVFVSVVREGGGAWEGGGEGERWLRER